MRKVLLFVNQDSTCSHQQPQHHEPGTGLPKGIAHGTHQRAGRDHEQAVGHAVHTDEGGALVTGDVVVQHPVLMEAPGFQRTLHQHTAKDAAQRGGRADQYTPDSAEDGADGVEPPQTARVQPPANLRAQHGGKSAEQQREKEQGSGPAQLHKALLDEHRGQVAGHADNGSGDNELCRQRAGAQDFDAVLYQLDELAG